MSGREPTYAKAGRQAGVNLAHLGRAAGCVEAGRGDKAWVHGRAYNSPWV